MKYNIITISREFGSGGRYIGECVAKKLNYKYYDKNIIEDIVEETGMKKEFVEKSGEYSPSNNLFAYSFVGRTLSGMSIEDYINNVQRKIILKAADRGPCVIIGRCGDYILREREDCLNIFIHGNNDVKSKRVSEIYNLSDEKAKKLMKDTDKRRRINYYYNTNREWGNIENYGMTLSSSILGMEKCVQIICDLV